MAEQGRINDRAQTGFAKSAVYDQYRPAYTGTATEELLKQVRVAGLEHAKILDLAAGTGKFTDGLAKRDEQYEIIAVEPHDGMRQVLTDKKLPGVTVKSGMADSIPLEDESVDAVIAAQVGVFSAPSCFGACRTLQALLKNHCYSICELSAHRLSTGSPTRPP